MTIQHRIFTHKAFIGIAWFKYSRRFEFWVGSHSYSILFR